MPRLPVIRAKEVVRALQKAGFVEVRSRGSHMQLKRGNLLVTIPMHRGSMRFSYARIAVRDSMIEKSCKSRRK